MRNNLVISVDYMIDGYSKLVNRFININISYFPGVLSIVGQVLSQVA